MISPNDYYNMQGGILNTCAIVGMSSTTPYTYNSEDIWMGLNEILASEGSAEEVNLSMVQYLLSRFSADDDTSYKNKGETEWPLNITISVEKVVTFRGRQLLHVRFGSSGVNSNRTPMNIEKYIADLRDVLVTTVGVDPELIESDGRIRELLPAIFKDHAVVDDGLIFPLDSSALPLELDARISELFKIKQKWTKVEFESFVVPILAPGTKPESLLIKNCRLDQDEDGKMYYSSKF